MTRRTVASQLAEEFARSSAAQMKRRSSPRSIGMRDPSLRWPHLYDILRAKGYSKEKAARIANSRLRYRKKGRLHGLPYQQADNPGALAKVRREQERKRTRTASALVAACYDRSCAPPPVGKGGSGDGGSLSQASRARAAGMRGGASSNTSVYPADTFKTRRPSDKNPKAPGADDRSAVRGHKGQHGDLPERRIPRQGETVDIYRDLGKGREHKRGFPDGDAFSVRHASALPGENVGLVVASTTGVILNSGRPAWAHAAKAAAEVKGQRGVHGFIRGEVDRYVNPEKLDAMVRTDPAWKKVTYYPGTQDFFDPGTRKRFVGSDQVALVKGEFFAKNPKYVNETAPISPIERKMQLAISRIQEFAEGDDPDPDEDNLFPESGSHHVSNGRHFTGTEEFYSPSQPRAKDGRWTLSGGGKGATPSPVAGAIRSSYMSSIGKDDPDITEFENVRAPKDFRNRIARAYARMSPDSPEAHAAYRTLAGEIRAQFDHMTASGIKVEVVDTDPYPTVRDMIRDVNQNRTLKVLSSATTGGHSIFGNEVNDMFRAVHDFYGHAATGRDFSRHGERATYLAHAKTMKSKDSVRALFTETEAQNAYLIANKAFGEQKIGLFPDKDVFYGLD